MSTAPPTTDKCRVCVVFWEGYLGVAPSIISAVERLLDSGFHVDLIIRDTGGLFPKVKVNEAVNVVSLMTLGSWLTRLNELGGVHKSSLPSLVVRVLGRLSAPLDFLRMIILCRRVVEENKPDIMVAIDDTGYAVSAQATRCSHVRTCYWSLELPQGFRIQRPFLAVTEYIARMRYSDIDFAIAQDRVRADLLRKHIGRSDEMKVFHVPNAPRTHAPVPGRTESIFHLLFNLPPTQKIVLYAGSISPEFLSEELATTAASWPAEWTLVMHERMRRPTSDHYLRKVREAGGDRVCLSLDPFPYERLPDVFKSADICVAMYSTEYGVNFSAIGSASGKAAWSLAMGIPLICNDVAGLATLVRQTKCGVVVQSLDDVASAVNEILEDYSGYCERAIRCSQECLSFDSAFTDVMAEIGLTSRWISS